MFRKKGESDMEGEFESCDIGHERIIYFSQRCPLCEAKAEIEAYKDSVENLLVHINEDYMVVIP